MKIYTKTGDQGKTSLFDGKRLSKDDIRIEAYGTIDELNAHIAILIQYCPQSSCIPQLTHIQQILFQLGAHLATESEEHKKKLPTLSTDEITLLEQSMDQMDAQLPPLKHFILPGGGLASSQAHVCRTVCRRAERRVVSLAGMEDINPFIVMYLNRLSDYFFVVSRWLSKEDGLPEHYWIP